MTFARTEADSTHVRVWCTQAPEGSLLDLELKKQTATNRRVGVYNGTGGPDAPWAYAFDKGGEYSFVAQELRIGTAFSGGYEKDPRGAPLETFLGAEATLKLYVGQRSEITIGAAPNTGTLVVWVWNDAIRHTSIAEHGEFTPSVASTVNERARAAARRTDASVRTILTNGMTAAAAQGDLPTYATALVDVWNAHLSQAVANGSTVHPNEDQTNVIPQEMGNVTLEGLTALAERFLRSERQHFLNDNGTGPGTEVAAPWHSVVSGPVGDQENLPITGGLSGVGDAYVALADVHFSLEEHKQSLAVHGAVDFSAMPSMPPLLQVARDFLDYLSQVAPTPAPGDTVAATRLRALGARVA